MRQLGQLLGIALAGDQGFDHPSAGQAHHIGDDRVELDVGIFECLLQPLDMAAGLPHQLLAGAQQGAHLLGLLIRHKAAADQAVRQQIGQPSRVVHIGLAPGHVLDMRRVGQHEFEVAFEHVPHGLPVHPGGFHRHLLDAEGFEPVGQRQQPRGGGVEGANLLYRRALISNPYASDHRLLVHVQRIDKVLEDANLKLGVVLADIMGKSGRAVLQAIVDGHTDPERLLTCIGRVKASRGELLEALRGRITGHHRFMLKLHLSHIDALDRAIADIEKEVGRGLDPFRQAAKLLTTMPGLSSVSSHVVVAEIGIDMSRFPTPGHLLSWACMCPRNDESAGKRRSTRLRRGGKWLKTTLVQAAWAAVKVKGSYLQAQFHRLRARRGAKKAIVAVAASMLTAAWHMLRDGTEWHDLCAAHFDRADAAKTANRLIRRLQQIGYVVQADWAAVKVKGSYLQAQFHHLRARRGAKKTIIGVAASMLTAVWHMPVSYTHLTLPTN